MSSRYLSQDQYIRIGHTFSRLLQDVLLKRLQDIFNTSSRRLAKTSSRSLQNFFKTTCKDIFKAFTRLIIKLNYLLLARLRQVFNTFLRHSFPKTVIHKGICLNSTMSEKFIVSHGTKFARQIKISQVLLFHFTTPFSSCLQRRI